MPTVKDQSTCEAIAREYCSNGRSKPEAMRAMGYAESSCRSGKAVRDVYSNLRVIAAINAIDAKNAANTDITREHLVKKMAEIVNESKSEGNRVRAASLIADMNGFKRDNAPNAEKEAARRAEMTEEEFKLNKAAAALRTAEEAEKPPGKVRRIG